MIQKKKAPLPAPLRKLTVKENKDDDELALPQFDMNIIEKSKVNGIKDNASGGLCNRCGEPIEDDEMRYEDESYHISCFVCAECFKPFETNTFFEHFGKRYCKTDHELLFCPSCARCGKFISGPVLKAFDVEWHASCFKCDNCRSPWDGQVFKRLNNRVLCPNCFEIDIKKYKDINMCSQCDDVIEYEKFKFKGLFYHSYHFRCKTCGCELSNYAREYESQLYCFRCYNKLGVAICAACRRPIENARVIHAMNQAWHEEHFVCVHCEVPFLGSRYYEQYSKPYCRAHYFELYGKQCFHCNTIIYGEGVTILAKIWCPEHYICFICEKKMEDDRKVFDFDHRPICKRCVECLPTHVLKSLNQSFKGFIS
ncbi:LIM and senescent cell antigen-like-containing domain protein 2 [Intoshia linei]|uniref:LIM and senescent cell antigen-like-containing domain protein 2 n=1 Tax=Intoshia linei TaxID=1819745 RepID=A0A177AZ06_9BILA|nr:LIM and senescent cell antigen-like-containing domain protein 2 [Intoshia linei]